MLPEVVWATRRGLVYQLQERRLWAAAHLLVLLQQMLGHLMSQRSTHPFRAHRDVPGFTRHVRMERTEKFGALCVNPSKEKSLVNLGC